jgi:hypothetical protein
VEIDKAMPIVKRLAACQHPARGPRAALVLVAATDPTPATSLEIGPVVADQEMVVAHRKGSLIAFSICLAVVAARGRAGGRLVGLARQQAARSPVVRQQSSYATDHRAEIHLKVVVLAKEVDPIVRARAI